MDWSVLKDLLGQREGLPVARDLETTKAVKGLMGLPQADANMGDLRVAEAQNPPKYFDKPYTEEEVQDLVGSIGPAAGRIENIAAKSGALNLLKNQQAQKLAEQLKARLIPNKQFGNTFVKDVLPQAQQDFGKIIQVLPKVQQGFGKIIRK